MAPTGPSTSDGYAGRGFALFGVICVLILGGGFGGWAATANIAGAVVAPGQLRVASQRQVVQHPDGGIVGEINARDGDVVAAGEVVVRLDGTRLRSELAALESQLYEIMSRRGRLMAEQVDADRVSFDEEVLEVAAERGHVADLVEGQRSLFHARRETMESELKVYVERQAQVEQQIVGVNAEVEAVARQAALAEEELADIRQLYDKGLARRDRMMALDREAARLQGQEGRLIARRAELRGQIAELEEQQLSLRVGRREEAIAELRELGFRELELKERRIQLEDQLSRLDVRAPRSGIVYDMQVHALESVVRAADPILYVVPNDSALVVEANVDPAKIDQVYVGQEAVLRLTAFNTRTTPEVFGAVVHVSADAFTEEQTGRSFYRVDVEMRPDAYEALEGNELVAGMPVEVYLQTGARTPIAYLVKPMTDYVNRAWRE